MKEHKFRCASLLKPVYSLLYSHENWDSLAKSSIRNSDNIATDELVNPHLMSLAEDISYFADTKILPAQTWGRILVDPVTVEHMYNKLRLLDNGKSKIIKDHMSQAREPQRFGIPGQVKAGWDLYREEDNFVLLTHVVQLTSDHSKVFMSAKTVDDIVAAEWNNKLLTSGPEAVIDIHRRFVRDEIDEFFS